MFGLWVRNIPWRRKWQPTPVLLPGEITWMEEPGGLWTDSIYSKLQLTDVMGPMAASSPMR